MQLKQLFKETFPLTLTLIVLTILMLTLIPVSRVSAATPIFVRLDGNDVECDGTANVAYPGGTGPLPCAVQTIQQGVSLVDAGGVVNVAAGTYTLTSAVTVSTANVTLLGAGAGPTIVQVSAGYDFYMGDRKSVV